MIRNLAKGITMDRVLVVGATGQLGLATVKELLNRGAKVRALIRKPEAAARFLDLGAEVALGDLTAPDSLSAACQQVTRLVATANAAVPTHKADTFEAVEGQGYRNLLEAATRAGVQRFVYTSVPESRHQDASPFLRRKRETEQALLASGLEYVIFRADIFMDISFAMMGNLLPLRGAEAATLHRRFGFANRYLQRVGQDLETKRQLTIPGDGKTRHAFICVDDVARFLTAAALGGPTGTFALGGPEALTYLDVVHRYEQVLGIPLRVKKTPKFVFWLAAKTLRPFHPAAANLMLLNYIAASEETLPDPLTQQAYPLPLTTCEAFLRRKASLAVGA